jgi:hypothetical protein
MKELIKEEKVMILLKIKIMKINIKKEYIKIDL